MFTVFLLGFSFMGVGVVCFLEKCKIRLTNLDKYVIGAVSRFRVYCNDVLTQNKVRMFKPCSKSLQPTVYSNLIASLLLFK